MLKPARSFWIPLQLIFLLRGSLACSDVSLRQVELKSAASTIHIDEGSNLHLVPDPQFFPGSEIYWQSSGSPISEYQQFLPCSEQDPPVVVHENGRDLLMIGVDETIGVQRLFANNGTRTISVQLKITKKAIAATDVSAALTWIGIIGGFFVVMIVFVVIVRYTRRTGGKEKKPESSVSASKQSEGATKNETETAKNTVPQEPFGIQIASTAVAAELAPAAQTVPPAATPAGPAATPTPSPPVQSLPPV